MRYELTDEEWAAIKPMLPNKPRSPAGPSLFKNDCH
jgi:transposase